MDKQSQQLWPEKLVYWRCRRGLKELDILLIDFYNGCYKDLDIKMKLFFQDLLLQPDPFLQRCLVFKKDMDKLPKGLQIVINNITIYHSKK